MTEENDIIEHYGTPRHSGRYPWGSGGDLEGVPRNADLLDHIANMRRQGLTNPQIAEGLGITTTQLRAQNSIARNKKKQADIAMAQRLKDKGESNTAIGKSMGINESSVRALLAPGQKDRADLLQATAGMLREHVDQKRYLDIGSGVENLIGVSSTRLSTAVAILKEEGYKVYYTKVPQLGTGLDTKMKILTPPDVTSSEVYQNRFNVRQITERSDDGGRSFFGLLPPISVDPKRVAVRYKEDGGDEADGVIYVRRGVKDLSMGNSTYVQTRIAVGDGHYLKGMAVYKDDLPDGVDLMFNTNKSSTGNKLDAFKKMEINKETGKVDEDNPFGSIVRQIGEKNPDGSQKTVTSALNIVNEEADWDRWSKTLSSQVLSKQSPALAKSQLAMTYEKRKQDLDDIMALTNPTVRKKLLTAYADKTDSASVHLKAAALPGQKTHVILPISSLKPTEIYAPNYDNGTRVALIRYPHGGTFEIPELVVNNRNREAIKTLGQGLENKAAVGIHHQVAVRLSGADFDGDTVLVIPNGRGTIKTTPALEGLKDFDARASYPRYEGMPKMSPEAKAMHMGDVSNLITDMTIQGAKTEEIARAVRHSMVVIDAEKHDLNYKQSAIDNGIKALKEKYQGGARKGASTLISRASSDVFVNKRKPRSVREGGPIDKATGKKVFTETGEGYVNAKGKFVPRTDKSKRLAETDDAYTLLSQNGGTSIERVYADHSNRLKALANEARKAAVFTKSTPYSQSAKTAYATEVASLDAALNRAIKNRPLERQAQVVANSVLATKRAAKPDMSSSEIKKVKAQALTEARIRTGAAKNRIIISPSEWAAIQAGAISTNKLTQILDNADLDTVKKLATPKTRILMTPTKTQRATSMLASGYTQAEVAAALGVSVTTLKDSVA